MQRFYLPPEECHGEMLFLRGREAHHASHVLRVRDGERVVVLDGAGQHLECEATGHKRDPLALRVVDRKRIPSPPCAITLIQALPKGKIIESIIQRATELGAARIVPLLSERVVKQFDSDSAEGKATKWQQVAIEAIKQCGQAWMPAVEAPMAVQAFLERGETFDLPLVGSLEKDSRHPRDWFEDFYSKHRRVPKSCCVWVGPEGDFSPAEYNVIKKAGVLPITLGSLVLRVETAATYCLSVLSYELQAAR